MGCVCGAGRHPTVGAGVVSPAGVKIHWRVAALPAPNDHFGAGPHCGVIDSWRGCANGGGSHPSVASRIISAASIANAKRGVLPAPDDHFAAGPYRSVKSTTQYIIRDAGSRPTVVGRVILAAGVWVDRPISSTPDNHFAPCPLYGVTRSSLRRIGRTSRGPTIRAWIVPPARI